MIGHDDVYMILRLIEQILEWLRTKVNTLGINSKHIK